MKQKTLICVIISILIILAIVIWILNNKKTDNTDIYNKLDFIDNENKYIITTNTKWISMQNDGGSHTDIYYQLDLNGNIVKKCEDKYVGLKGYEYQGKILFSKELNDIEKSQLKSIFDNIIKNRTEKVDKINFDFYIISLFNNEDIKIYDNDIINSIKNILEK